MLIGIDKTGDSLVIVVELLDDETEARLEELKVELEELKAGPEDRVGYMPLDAGEGSIFLM